VCPVVIPVIDPSINRRSGNLRMKGEDKYPLLGKKYDAIDTVW